MSHQLPDYGTLRGKAAELRNALDLLYRDFEPTVDRVRAAKARKRTAAQDAEVFRALGWAAFALNDAYKAARDAVAVLDFLMPQDEKK